MAEVNVLCSEGIPLRSRSRGFSDNGTVSGVSGAGRCCGRSCVFHRCSRHLTRSIQGGSCFMGRFIGLDV